MSDKPNATCQLLSETISDALNKLTETHEVGTMELIGVLATMTAYHRGNLCQQWQAQDIMQRFQDQALINTPVEGGVQ